jgi:hypothetical protein
VELAMIDDYILLFRGRGDCHGGWGGVCVREPLTPQHFHDHLHDGPHIGVYPHFNLPGTTDTVCIWGCTDIDHTDDPYAAFMIRDTFRAVEVSSWVERSANGWHVWVFATELVPAVDMRRMFLAAHQVALVPAKEVNPKQEQLLGTQVGNYVRLPYPAYLTRGITERYVVDTVGAPLAAEAFVEQANAERTPPDRIKFLADHYQPPAQFAATFTREPSGDVVKVASDLERFAYVVFRDGPQGHRDRSSALTFLANECVRSGISPADALLILKDADERWGKYSVRGAAGLLEIEKLVLRVYGPSVST